MLRYYDETGLLKPLQVYKSTGYRLNGIEQIPRLQQIILLRGMDFSAAEIAKVLVDWTAESITKHLPAKQKELEASIQQQNRISKIAMAAFN